MNLITEFEIRPTYLFVKISGMWTKEDAFELIEKIKTKAIEIDLKRILLDLVNFSVPISEMTRFYTGEKIASSLISYKIAGYSQHEKINKFAEVVTVNRGGNLKMFDSETEALNWLLS